MASAPLLDREFLEKLERLTIHWQKSFAGLVGGHNHVALRRAPARSFSTIATSITATTCARSTGAPTCAWRSCSSRCSRWSRACPCACCWTPAPPWAHGGVKFDYARKLAAALCYVGLVRLDTHRDPRLRRPPRAARLLRAAAATAFGGVMDGLQRARGGRRHRLSARDPRVHRHLFAARPGDRRSPIFWTTTSCEKALQYLTRFRPRADAAPGLGGRGSRRRPGPANWNCATPRPAPP